MIDIDITTIRKIAEEYLLSFGFPKKHINYIVENLIEAELNGKSSHGIQTLLSLASFITSKSIRVHAKPTVKVINNFLHIDSTAVSGYVSMSYSLEKAVSLLNNTNVNLVLVAIKNMSYSPGYIGAYARKASESGLFFLGFSKSPGGVVPYGGAKGVFGTNPITFSVSHRSSPVIVDTSIGKISLSTLLTAQKNNSKLLKNVAIDAEGKITTNSTNALKGGILPIAEHKGSSLALISEILAGAFIDSPINSFNQKDPKWGYFYILGHTDIFIDGDKFEKNMDELNKKHKDSAISGEQIFYPGERSSLLKKSLLKSGKIKIDSLLLEKIKERIV